jgi:hypothetical protein
MTSKRKADDELSGHLPKIPAHVVGGRLKSILRLLTDSFCQAPTKDIQGSSTEGLEPDPGSHDIYHAGIPQKLQALAAAVPKIPTVIAPQDHVYRVRGLPWEISSQQISDLVSTLFKLESDTSAPRIRSLAKAPDGRTMVATLSFRTIPAELSGDDEWPFDITNFLRNLQAENEDIGCTRQSRTLTIDDHFRGLTILSSPPPSDHKVEYINSQSVYQAC